MSALDSAVNDVKLPQPSNGNCEDSEDSGDSEDSEDSEDIEDSEYDSAEEEMFFKGKDIGLDRWTDTEDSDSEPEDSPAKRNKVEEEEVKTSQCRASPSETACGLCDDQDEPQCPSSPPARWRTHEETDVGPSPLPFRPVRPTGPQHEVIKTKRPLDYFKLFFSSSVIATLVQNTNAYGAGRSQKMNETWTEVTPDDMFSFISLALYMNFMKLAEVGNYWSDDKMLNLEFPRTVMSQIKFLNICHCLHLSSLETDAENRALKGTPRHDPLGKIKPLYLKLAEACKANFQPDQNLCINERMVAQKQIGRLFTEGGYRVFSLADSATCYTWNISVCENGESSSADRALSYASVIDLADTEHLGSGYHLYLEKAHASPRIVQDLWAKGIGVCAVVAKTKKGFPRMLENDLTSSDARGSLRWAREGEMLFVKWKDAGEVAVCSTVHVAYNGETVRKRQKVGEKFVPQLVPFPPAVKDHGEHMRDVDDSKFLTEHINVLMKPKWYQILFFHFLNIAVKNAHILYNHCHKRQQMKQRGFLEMLIQQMVDNKTENVTL